MDERNSARASCTSALHPMAGSLPDIPYEDDASSNVAALQGITPITRSISLSLLFVRCCSLLWRHKGYMKST